MSTVKKIDADVTAALDRWVAAIGGPDHQAASEALDAILVELCASRGRTRPRTRSRSRTRTS